MTAGRPKSKALKKFLKLKDNESMTCSAKESMNIYQYCYRQDDMSCMRRSLPDGTFIIFKTKETKNEKRNSRGRSAPEIKKTVVKKRKKDGTVERIERTRIDEENRSSDQEDSLENYLKRVWKNK